MPDVWVCQLLGGIIHTAAALCRGFRRVSVLDGLPIGGSVQAKDTQRAKVHSSNKSYSNSRVSTRAMNSSSGLGNKTVILFSRRPNYTQFVGLSQKLMYNGSKHRIEVGQGRVGPHAVSSRISSTFG